MTYKKVLLIWLIFGVVRGDTFTIPSIDWPLLPLEDSLSIGITQVRTSGILALEDINNNPNILPNITLEVNTIPVALVSSLAISAMIDFANENYSFVLGSPSTVSSEQTAIVGEVLDIAQFSSTVADATISNFPNYFRLVPKQQDQILAIKATILYYAELAGRGWTEVGIISTTGGYGISIANNFIAQASPEIEVISYRQFLPDLDSTEIDRKSEMEEIKRSGARVLLAAIFDEWEPFVLTADEAGLIGDQYVWFVPNVIAATTIVDERARILSQGVLGPTQTYPDSSQREEFVQRWGTLDPDVYLGAGPEYPPNSFTFLQYDMIQVAALAVEKASQRGILNDERIPAATWVEILREIELQGISGPITFDSNGDRPAGQSMLYYDSTEQQWLEAAEWYYGSYKPVRDIVWFSNTTELPDLDVREPFSYWSCHKGERGYDETGKTVVLHTPDGSDIDDIDSDYHCDNFIDCKNLSDESEDCASNFTTLFIVFGVITGVLIFISFLLVVFVFIFGCVLQYRRLRKASPFFLLLLLFSVIVGYSSIFAWFGKPTSVACGFRPWLLGLPVISMITALSVKIFRMWRIFRFPWKKTRITDLELFILWFVIMVPGFVLMVLWTILATPVAAMQEHGGNDHYVCTAGGVTGEVGEPIFAAIFIFYSFLILCAGMAIAILARKVPSQFNEGKLLAISIYNLALLSVVIIPVYIVVEEFNPFIAWILRSIAVLYAFTATLILQFLPNVINICFVDKCKNVKTFRSNVKAPSQLSTSSPSPSPSRSS